MKYTIELTNKQKAQMDCMIDIVHRYVGFNPRLEPIKTTNVEDTNEYQIGYKVGFEDGKKQAIEEIPELANKENEIYNDGYNKALDDVNHAIDVLVHMTGKECAEWFEGRMGVYKVVCDYSIQRIVEITKAYEEKKKAEDEIRVGDEVITSNGYIAIITFICDEYMTAIFHDGSSGEFINETLKKTGRHFGEVEQLLDKLRGEEDEKNCYWN